MVQWSAFDVSYCDCMCVFVPVFVRCCSGSEEILRTPNQTASASNASLGAKARRGDGKAAPAKAACATAIQPQLQQLQTATVWLARPVVVNVNQVQTVMTTQWQYQQQTRTVVQPVARTVMTPVTVPVQAYEARTAIQQVVQNVPVRVQRAVTSNCQCTQQIAGFAPTVTASQPVTQYVTTIENRPQVVNRKVSYQVPVTRYATQYQQQQVMDYQPVQQTVNVPVAVQIPVQQFRSVPTVQYQYVPQQVFVGR